MKAAKVDVHSDKITVLAVYLDKFIFTLFEIVQNFPFM